MATDVAHLGVTQHVALPQENSGYHVAAFATGPLVTKTLTAARTANADVDASTWDDVRSDTAAAQTRMNSGPGSAFDKRIRAALESFSDSELQSLNSKLNDPLLLRFRHAVQGLPQENAGAAMSNMLQMVVQINAILTKHNLKPISFQ
jgi:hypothetical protein